MVINVINAKKQQPMLPRCSMYEIFTYIWVIDGVDVGMGYVSGTEGLQLVQRCSGRGCPPSLVLAESGAQELLNVENQETGKTHAVNG